MMWVNADVQKLSNWIGLDLASLEDPMEGVDSLQWRELKWNLIFNFTFTARKDSPNPHCL